MERKWYICLKLELTSNNLILNFSIKVTERNVDKLVLSGGFGDHIVILSRLTAQIEA